MLICANSLLIALGYIFCLSVVPIFLGYRNQLHVYWRDIGFTNFNGKSLLILFIFIGFTIAIGLASREFHGIYANKGPMITAIEPPLVEELMFRGIIMSLLLRRFSWWFSILWSSILFACIHIELGSITYVIAAFIGALFVLSILRLQSNNIWSGAFAHFAMIRGLARPVILAFTALEICIATYWWSKRLRDKFRDRQSSI